MGITCPILMDLGFYDMMDVRVEDFKKKTDLSLAEYIEFEKDNIWKVEDLSNIKSCVVEENTLSTNFNGFSPPPSSY